VTGAIPEEQFSYLDSVLEEVCIGVQLTQAQYDDATQKYQSIGGWLAHPNSPLVRYSPDVYAQGSMRLGTTIRPWRGEEFDLDIVCQLHYCDDQPALSVYNLVAARLKEHGTYRAILQTKNRCLRIDYAGNFHLDIIPACPNGGTAIKVPDRELAAWVSSNPLGYADWFFGRCRYERGLGKAVEARIRPMPSNVPSEHKYPLQRAVQLLKRHRDSFFDGNLDAARSILLTTLAARAYTGEDSLTLALDAIVSGICSFTTKTVGIPRVPNPTNPDENFACGWNAQTYPQFVKYIHSVRRYLDELMRGGGIDQMTKSLGGFVGRPLAERAVSAHAHAIEKLRGSRTLRVEPRTGFLTTGAGLAIPRNNYYGA
jgi:hypothetical protein